MISSFIIPTYLIPAKVKKFNYQPANMNKYFDIPM